MKLLKNLEESKKLSELTFQTIQFLLYPSDYAGKCVWASHYIQEIFWRELDVIEGTVACDDKIYPHTWCEHLSFEYIVDLTSHQFEKIDKYLPHELNYTHTLEGCGEYWEEISVYDKKVLRG